MTRYEIKEFILKNFKDKLNTNSCSNTIRFKYKEVYNKILKETSYLDKLKFNFNERIFHIIYDLFEIQKCECGKYLKFINFQNGYRDTCKKCKNCKGIEFENKDNVLCNYGCGKVARFKFKSNDNFCCEQFTSKCPTIIQKVKNDGIKNGMFGKKSPKRHTLETLKKSHPILFEHENIRYINNEFEVTCKNCGKWFQVKSSSLQTRAMVLERGNKRNFLFCSKECAESSGIYRLINSPKTNEEYKNYHWKVYLKTEYYIKKYGYKISNIHLRSKDFSIDHKYSVREAFDNNVSIDVVSHYKNLEIISRSKNSKKRKNCSITLEQLIQGIEECGDK